MRKPIMILIEDLGFMPYKLDENGKRIDIIETKKTEEETKEESDNTETD